MEVVFVILFGIIVILLVIETFFYKQLLNTAIALQGLAGAYNESLNYASSKMETLSTDQLKVRQDMDLYEKELHVLRLVVGIHSEALNVKQLKDLFDAVDALKNS